MTDPHDRVGVARPEGPFWWLSGRAGRREYWAVIGALTLLSFLLRGLPPFLHIVFPILMAGVQVRRLHDFDRSGWWAVAATLVGLVPALAIYFTRQTEDIAVAVDAIISLVAIVWIGVVPGTRSDNRYGPAPPFTMRRVLTGR